MAKFEIIMPKLGESVIEATITKWHKNPGDNVEEDDAIAELATDKVDSEIPSPVEGKILELLYNEGDVVAVGLPIAVIEIEGDDDEEEDAPESDEAVEPTAKASATESVATEPAPEIAEGDFSSATRFYSPLVKSIAKQENISLSELEKISGSGKNDRVNKDDILQYIKDKAEGKTAVSAPKAETQTKPSAPAARVSAPPVSVGLGDEIVEMDRMRKLIADHMVMSVKVSPHVTSFIEVDVTNLVKWRNKVKDAFLKKEGQKITYTPIFLEAAAKTLRNFPMINASVDGSKIIKRKNINLGMAAALPNGNLIVPVIKSADELNLVGMAKRVNDLAQRARANKLEPDEIQGGTFTVTNFGSFDSLTGTPIINQPQVAILGLGAIKKRPVVIETPQGDVIGIRQIIILSLAYDHRIVDGALAGTYLKQLRDNLEGFDVNASI